MAAGTKTLPEREWVSPAPPPGGPLAPPRAEPAPERTSGSPTRSRPLPVRDPDRAQVFANRRAWLVVGVLCVVGLAVRLLLARGIWVDEAISIDQAQLGLPEMLDDLRDHDNHPPLHYLFLWAAVRLFGIGEVAVRLPSVLAGTALIPALFLAGRELFDRRAGLAAAVFGTVAPLLVWYSQEARMYVLVMLFATLAVWAQMRVLNDGRSRWWFAYGAFTVAMIYSNYFALVPIAIQQLGFGAAAWRRAHRDEPVGPLLTGYWITWLGIVAAVAPLAPFALDQFQANQASGFQNAPSGGSASALEGDTASVYAVISNLAWMIWGYHANSTMLAIAALWPLLMLVSLLALGRGRSPSATLALGLAFGPVLAFLVIGTAKRELFEVRYFAAAAPMVLLLLARAVTAAPIRRAPAALATGAVFATLLAGLVDQQLADNPREFDFRGALAEVRDSARQGDAVMFAPGYLRDVVAYYAPRVEREPIPRPGERGPRGGRVFLVGSFLEDEAMANRVRTARTTLTDAGRRLERVNEHGQIRIWEYR